MHRIALAQRWPRFIPFQFSLRRQPRPQRPARGRSQPCHPPALDAAGPAITAAPRTSIRRDCGDRHLLELAGQGAGLIGLTVAQSDRGGRFVRRPRRPGLESGVVNRNRRRYDRATGPRALGADVGLKLAGRPVQAPIAVFDPPKNSRCPLPWRVDTRLGLGPSRPIAGDGAPPGARPKPSATTSSSAPAPSTLSPSPTRGRPPPAHPPAPASGPRPVGGPQDHRPDRRTGRRQNSTSPPVSKTNSPPPNR